MARSVSQLIARYSRVLSLSLMVMMGLCGSVPARAAFTDLSPAQVRDLLFGSVPGFEGVAEYFSACSTSGCPSGDLWSDSRTAEELNDARSFYDAHFRATREAFGDEADLASNPFLAARQSFLNSLRGVRVEETQLTPDQVHRMAIERVREGLGLSESLDDDEVLQAKFAAERYLIQVRKIEDAERIRRPLPSNPPAEWAIAYLRQVREVRLRNLRLLQDPAVIPVDKLFKIKMQQTTSSLPVTLDLTGKDLLAATWDLLDDKGPLPAMPAEFSVTSPRGRGWVQSVLMAIPEYLNTLMERVSTFSITRRDFTDRKAISQLFFLPPSGALRWSDLKAPMQLKWKAEDVPRALASMPRAQDGSVSLDLPAEVGGAFLLAVVSTHLIQDFEAVNLPKRKTANWHRMADAIGRERELARLKLYLETQFPAQDERLAWISLLNAEQQASKRREVQPSGQVKEIEPMSDFDRAIESGGVPTTASPEWEWAKWAGYHIHPRYWELRDRVAAVVGAPRLDAAARVDGREAQGSSFFKEVRARIDERMRRLSPPARAGLMALVPAILIYGAIEIRNFNTPNPELNDPQSRKEVRVPMAQIKSFKPVMATVVKKPDSPQTIFRIVEARVPARDLPTFFPMAMTGQSVRMEALDIASNANLPTIFKMASAAPASLDQWGAIPVPSPDGFVIKDIQVSIENPDQPPVPVGQGIEAATPDRLPGTPLRLGQHYTLKHDAHRGLTVLQVKSPHRLPGAKAWLSSDDGPHPKFGITFSMDITYARGVAPVAPKFFNERMDPSSVALIADRAEKYRFMDLARELRSARSITPVQFAEAMSRSATYSYKPVFPEPFAVDAQGRPIVDSEFTDFTAYLDQMDGHGERAGMQCSSSNAQYRAIFQRYMLGAGISEKELVLELQPGLVRENFVINEVGHVKNRFHDPNVPNTWVDADPTPVSESWPKRVSISPPGPRAVPHPPDLTRRPVIIAEPAGPLPPAFDLVELQRLTAELVAMVKALDDAGIKRGQPSIMTLQDFRALPLNILLQLSGYLQRFFLERSSRQDLWRELNAILPDAEKIKTMPPLENDEDLTPILHRVTAHLTVASKGMVYGLANPSTLDPQMRVRLQILSSWILNPGLQAKSNELLKFLGGSTIRKVWSQEQCKAWLQPLVRFEYR